jgi:hypothetical protein
VWPTCALRRAQLPANQPPRCQPCEGQANDGLILAETSLAGIPLLVTSDKHLLNIDEDALLLAFNEADLAPVHPVHPKNLLRALR